MKDNHTYQFSLPHIYISFLRVGSVLFELGSRRVNASLEERPPHHVLRSLLGYPLESTSSSEVMEAYLTALLGWLDEEVTSKLSECYFIKAR